MHTITRRRLVAISLALSALVPLPRTPFAQTSTAPNKLPKCPTKEGTVGDWDWYAHATGWDVSVRQVRVLDRGDFVGQPSKFFLRLSAGSTAPSIWSMELLLSRQPSGPQITITATGGGRYAIATVASSIVKPGQGSNKGSWVAIINLSPLFQKGGVDLTQAPELSLELKDGNRTIAKFTAATKAFGDATLKASTEAKPIWALYDSKACAADACYLTTLCVELIGLPDDCFELQTLRAYRDGPLLALPGGKDVIAQYYAQAPQIVAEVLRRDDVTWFLRFYWSHVLPCVLFAKLGLNRLALRRYSDMMSRLNEKYTSATEQSAWIADIPGANAADANVEHEVFHALDRVPGPAAIDGLGCEYLSMIRI